MDDYTLHVDGKIYRLKGTQLDAVRVGARVADRWHRGEPVTFMTVEGEVTLERPAGWPHVRDTIQGPWDDPEDNPWSTPG